MSVGPELVGESEVVRDWDTDWLPDFVADGSSVSVNVDEGVTESDSDVVPLSEVDAEVLFDWERSSEIEGVTDHDSVTSLLFDSDCVSLKEIDAVLEGLRDGVGGAVADFVCSDEPERVVLNVTLPVTLALSSSVFVRVFDWESLLLCESEYDDDDDWVPDLVAVSSSVGD